MATFLVARTGLAGVDEWQAERVAQIGRIKARGESIASIAALANISETEVRSYLKAASATGAVSTRPPRNSTRRLIAWRGSWPRRGWGEHRWATRDCGPAWARRRGAPWRLVGGGR
jgi:hypothetical protein